MLFSQKKAFCWNITFNSEIEREDRNTVNIMLAVFFVRDFNWIKLKSIWDMLDFYFINKIYKIIINKITQ